MNKKLEALKRAANVTAEKRGHKMGMYTPSEWYRTTQASSYCRLCAANITVNTAPMPNGIGISGTAVALDCNIGRAN